MISKCYDILHILHLIDLNDKEFIFELLVKLMSKKKVFL